MVETLLFLAALLLVVLGGVMSAVDAALSVSSRGDLVDFAAEAPERQARALARIADDPDAHADAVTFVRVLSEMAAAVLVTAAFTLAFASIWWAILAAAVVMTVLSFVAVYSSPRALGRRGAEPLLRFAAPLVHGVRVVLGPVARLLMSIGARATPGGGRRSFESEEQLLSIVDEAASNDLIDDDDRELVHSVFDFTDQVVRAVMVPRTDMITVDASVTTREALQAFLDTGISRMPVVDGEVDDVVGVLYLKDLVQFGFRETPGWRDASVRPLARPAVFVPEQMRAETLLQQMKREAVHVCLVVDEYGGIAGIVTLEDLIEELVGEISDEYDTPTTEIVELGEGSYRVAARLSLDEVGDLFGIELEDEDVDSIGGLLGKQLGHVPQPGETVEVAGLVLTGGTSRGRGRGLATVFVEAGEGLRALADVRSRQPRTGEITVPSTGETPIARGRNRKDRSDD
ncbi:hemolysin family protein [Microbacterium sediminis]|uniref:Hemolysin n=1 Tax=Microbacterium sediminis TaxID=904291 RepID=A0A1B9NGS0_9MICO|nr:hemolysin family protein [Microbacterium sediminis]OCG75807.1 hemolysin [Microbacterium sediminis]QBR74199.1 HlyC/CorC family transporter [Microbacterium sediminis]